ncbi:MAG: N-acetylmuramoyl-L-alanine amidase [Abditibacteriota bacterium]|nr:N-acetylmuramoyl-L-alanine amidase [Abditibacteriota bacterium]
MTLRNIVYYILPIICMALLSSAAVSAKDTKYNVKVDGKAVTCAMAVKQGRDVLVSPDIFNHLGLDYEQMGQGNIRIMGTESVISCVKMMDVYLINVNEIADATGCDVVETSISSSINFVNKIRNIEITDDLLELDLAFPCPYTVFVYDNRLIFDFDSLKKSPENTDYTVDNPRISGVRFGTPEANTTRVVFDLLGKVPNSAKYHRKENIIRYDLKVFGTTTLPEISKVELHPKYDGSCELVLKNGAFTHPVVSCDIHKGQYTVSVKNCKITYKGVASDNGLRVSVLNNQTLLVASEYIRDVEVRPESKDTVIVFYAPLVKKLSDVTVTIDAGHGGTDKGAIYGSFFEKDLNLLAAGEVARALAEKGVNVHMTRTDDSTLSLKDRGAFAIKKDSDLMISFHCNSCKGTDTGTGIETYYHKDYTLSKYFGELFHSEFVKNNSLLNRKLHSDTALYSSGLGVLRAANAGGVPGILVEMGFINNSRDRALLTSPDYRQKIAEDVLTAVTRYFEARPVNHARE